MELELAGAIAQLGAAGLIGLMWLSERRSATERERQLTEQHERLKRDRTELSVLVSVLESNTRALTSLEAGQSRLVVALEHRWDGPGRVGVPGERSVVVSPRGVPPRVPPPRGADEC